MKYYLDCEFDGYSGHLISMALAPEDGLQEPFYWVRDPMPPVHDEWVRENVLPILDIDSASVGTVARLASYLEEYLSWDGQVDIIADWPDDVKYFCEVMITGPGQRIDTPPITFEIVRYDSYPTTLEGAVQHNALWDALALRHYVRNLRMSDALSARGEPK